MNLNKLKLFDLHCDTISEMFLSGQPLFSNELQLSLQNASRYEAYSQLFAVWSDQKLQDDENYENFFKIVKNAASEFTKNASPSFTPYLAVEGGKLLGGDIGRLDALRRAGVRFLTLVWGDTCCVGGAHNTDEGLTDFGREVVRRCFELDIIPDLSHASDKTFDDIYRIASEYKKPVIATHSNSRAVCSHRRNLTDDMFCRIKDIGGIVGVSLCRPHLADGGECGISDVIKHISHYLSLGGEKTICLGCDLDGIDRPPDGIKNIGDLYKIAGALSDAGLSDGVIEDIFYGNAEAFIKRNDIIPEIKGEI